MRDSDEMRRRLAGGRVARLATLSADGAPRLVPVCFVVERDLIHSAIDGKPKSTRRLARLATAYVQHAKYDGDWRIDVIAIDGDGLRHIKNAVSLW